MSDPIQFPSSCPPKSEEDQKRKHHIDAPMVGVLTVLLIGLGYVSVYVYSLNASIAVLIQTGLITALYLSLTRDFENSLFCGGLSAIAALQIYPFIFSSEPGKDFLNILAAVAGGMLLSIACRRVEQATLDRKS